MNDTSLSDRSSVAGHPVSVVSLLLVLDSLHFVFARLLLPHFPPVVSAMYVLAIGTLEVALFGLIRRSLKMTQLIKNVWFFLAIGFLIAASTTLNYECVAFIDPGTASLLKQTEILFGLGFAVLWFRDRLTPGQVFGLLVALSGVFVITFQPGDYLRIGSLLVVGSALLYALHAAVTKRYAGRIDFFNFLFLRLLYTTGFLFVFALGRRVLVWPGSKSWPLLLLVGTIDVVFSRAIYYVALRQLKMSIFSTVMTLSPLATVLWSFILFGTVPTLQQLAGGGAVILGVMVVTNQART
jgi:O-acetylserine/cysteine efflux transporter